MPSIILTGEIQNSFFLTSIFYHFYSKLVMKYLDSVIRQVKKILVLLTDVIAYTENPMNFIKTLVE